MCRSLLNKKFKTRRAQEFGNNQSSRLSFLYVKGPSSPLHSDCSPHYDFRNNWFWEEFRHLSGDVCQMVIIILQRLKKNSSFWSYQPMASSWQLIIWGYGIFLAWVCRSRESWIGCLPWTLWRQTCLRATGNNIRWRNIPANGTHSQLPLSDFACSMLLEVAWHPPWALSLVKHKYQSPGFLTRILEHVW